MKHLLLWDNQDVTRVGMKTIALATGLFDVAEEVNSARQLIDCLKRWQELAVVVVLDFTQTSISADYLLLLSERFKCVSWLLFSENLSEVFLRRMLYSSSAFGVVMKDAVTAEIEEALRMAFLSRQYISPRIASWLCSEENKKEGPDVLLTKTEKEILRSIACGYTTKEIATARYLSVHTVLTHRKNIFRKLHVNNVYEAIKYALRSGLIDMADYCI